MEKKGGKRKRKENDNLRFAQKMDESCGKKEKKRERKNGWCFV